MPTAPRIAHETLHALLARYGVREARVRRVAHLGMQVFRVTPPDAGPGGELALRVYGGRLEQPAQIASELAWLDAMAGDGLNVPAPRRDLDGRLLQPWPGPRPGDPPSTAVVLRWLPGRCLTRRLTPTHLREVGTLLGRMRRVAQALADAGRLPSTQTSYVADLRSWAAADRVASPHLTPNARAAVRAAADRLHAELSPLPRDPDHHGYIHGDAHLWNLLFDRGRAGLIDFSECGWGLHALELAATLQYLRHPLPGYPNHGGAYAPLRDALLDAYAAQCPLPAQFDRQVDACIGARMILTLEWVLEDWPRVDHRAWGPAFLAGCEEVFRGYAGQPTRINGALFRRG